MKRPHLVLYDYGQGAVWAYILAPSTQVIMERFPQLSIYPEPPKWMTSGDVDEIKKKMTIDIDDESNRFLATLKFLP